MQAGINIVLKALEAPIRQIAENSGVEGSIVVGKIIDNKSETFGFDAQNEEYVDMVEPGIIDPAKVVRTALQDAASVAGLLVTTEAMVAELPKETGAGDAARRRHGRRNGLLVEGRSENAKGRGRGRAPFNCGAGTQRIPTFSRFFYQPIVRGSQSASCGKKKHSTSATSCITTNGTMPR